MLLSACSKQAPCRVEGQVRALSTMLKEERYCLDVVTQIRAARAGKDFSSLLRANVEVGLYGAVPCLMANIAMRENRTVYWSEFFPNGEKA